MPTVTIFISECEQSILAWIIAVTANFSCTPIVGVTLTVILALLVIALHSLIQQNE